jgi:TonB family protein
VSRRRTHFQLPVLAVMSLVVVSAGYSQTRDTEQSEQERRHEQPKDSDVALGKPIAWESPKYPKEARRNKTQGTVVLRLTVAKDGKVTAAEVLSGDLELVEAASRAVRKWQYVPYFHEAQPTEVQTIVSINFKITETGKPEVTAAYEEPPPAQIARIFKPSDGVTPPKPIYTPDPEFSEEARAAKYDGTCVLSLIVGADGRPYDIKVSRALGKGLDEKAIEAVRQWRFKPAMKEGEPVSVVINVEVQFRL